MKLATVLLDNTPTVIAKLNDADTPRRLDGDRVPSMSEGIRMGRAALDVLYRQGTPLESPAYWKVIET